MSLALSLSAIYILCLSFIDAKNVISIRNVDNSIESDDSSGQDRINLSMPGEARAILFLTRKKSKKTPFFLFIKNLNFQSKIEEKLQKRTDDFFFHYNGKFHFTKKIAFFRF